MTDHWTPSRCPRSCRMSKYFARAVPTAQEVSISSATSHDSTAWTHFEDMTTAADVYVTELFPLGHGLPIWNPDPVTAGEVRIGDVGYFERGTFFRLFNTMNGAHDPNNEGCQLPDHFAKLSLPDRLQYYDPRAVQAGALCSKTVKIRSIAAQLNGMNAAQGSFTIDRSKEQGAMLFLHDDGERREIHDNDLMPQYMLDHYQHWIHLANEIIHLKLDVDELYFVRGFVKSKSWAIMAFEKANRSYSGSVNVQFGPSGLMLAANWTDESHIPPVTRSGPVRPRSTLHPLITDDSLDTAQYIRVVS
ncbi:hypothetical protein OBBRIDRAFT_381083 [Obba rivulosa]|uniref:Uncharacterized protein n=1 Tax=Obba rivulosa TaxID=1052685 RepID=A0A8E2B5H5_9APHY|nr:hypothetical protein OBBRIDRAFT_381083 [Obba rivulosa]